MGLDALFNGLSQYYAYLRESLRHVAVHSLTLCLQATSVGLLTTGYDDVRCYRNIMRHCLRTAARTSLRQLVRLPGLFAVARRVHGLQLQHHGWSLNTEVAQCTELHPPTVVL